MLDWCVMERQVWAYYNDLIESSINENRAKVTKSLPSSSHGPKRLLYGPVEWSSFQIYSCHDADVSLTCAEDYIHEWQSAIRRRALRFDQI